MTAGNEAVFARKSWADDIDEMNRDALESYLEGAWPRRGARKTSLRPIDGSKASANAFGSERPGDRRPGSAPS